MPEGSGRVVITGVGSVSGLGVGAGAAVAAALGRGESAMGPVRAFSTAECPSHLGAEVGDLAAHLTPDEARRLPRVSQLAVVACRQAAADAGIEPGTLSELGLVLGSHYGDFRSSETFARGYLTRGPLGLSPLVFPSTVMNTMAAHAAIALGAQGPMLTVNQAGVAGELAVARAARFITAGRATAMLAGGVDELCGILYRELARLHAMSPGGSGPEGCRPFDRRANGTVAGEGATVVLLEAAEAAARRGARVYAELRGAAWGNLPSPARGFPARRRRDPAVVRHALTAARVAAADVGAAYLTGSGDPAQDACELDLIAAAFDDGPGRAPRLTALTSLAGEHAGLGVLRVAAAALLTLGGRCVPVLAGLETPVRSGFDFVTAASPREVETHAALVHGLARGGSHVALVLGRAA